MNYKCIVDEVYTLRSAPDAVVKEEIEKIPPYSPVLWTEKNKKCLDGTHVFGPREAFYGCFDPGNRFFGWCLPLESIRVVICGVHVLVHTYRLTASVRAGSQS